MKKIFLFVFALFVGMAVVSAQNSNQPELVNGAAITFVKTTHDFGSEIPLNSQDVEYSFEFTNTGNEPLVLSNVRANCGCTTPTWSKEPILPGKTGIVKAKYTTTNRAGQFRKQITVSSNATNGPQVLNIMGTVVANSTNNELLKNPEETNAN